MHRRWTYCISMRMELSILCICICILNIHFVHKSTVFSSFWMEVWHYLAETLNEYYQITRTFSGFKVTKDKFGSGKWWEEKSGKDWTVYYVYIIHKAKDEDHCHVLLIFWDIPILVFDACPNMEPWKLDQHFFCKEAKAISWWTHAHQDHPESSMN